MQFENRSGCNCRRSVTSVFGICPGSNGRWSINALGESGSRITVGDRGNCSFVLLERLINCSHPASLLTELIVCVSVCMVKLLNNREHIFRGASRTYKIKIPMGLEGPAGRAGQTGRLAAWQLPPRFTGRRGSVLGQPLDQGSKDSGLRLSGKSGAQKLARCSLEFGVCRAVDFPGTLTLKQVAPTNRRRGSPPVRLQLLR